MPGSEIPIKLLAQTFASAFSLRMLDDELFLSLGVQLSLDDPGTSLEQQWQTRLAFLAKLHPLAFSRLCDAASERLQLSPEQQPSPFALHQQIPSDQTTQEPNSPVKPHSTLRSDSALFQSRGWLIQALRAGESIAKVVHQQTGQHLGTAFLVDGSLFGLPNEPSVAYALTNAHVVSNDEICKWVQERYGTPCVTAHFAQLQFTNGCHREVELVWTSFVDGVFGEGRPMDATLLRMQRPIDALARPIARWTGQERVNVVGFPQGYSDLQWSVQDNRTQLPTGVAATEPFFRYTTPTLPGSSGSPVFDNERWELLGLHRGEWTRGQLKEGILLDAIVGAARRDLGRARGHAAELGWLDAHCNAHGPVGLWGSDALKRRALVEALAKLRRTDGQQVWFVDLLAIDNLIAAKQAFSTTPVPKGTRSPLMIVLQCTPEMVQAMQTFQQGHPCEVLLCGERPLCDHALHLRTG